MNSLHIDALLAKLPVEQQDIVDILLCKRRGTFVVAETVRPMKMRVKATKAGISPVYKQSLFQFRVGVDYDNIQTVKDGRADGTLPAQNAGLPWGEWEIFPFVIHHKGEYYIRCTSANTTFNTQARYIQDGVEITKAEAELVCLGSEFSKGEPSDVFNIKVSSILNIR